MDVKADDAACSQTSMDQLGVEATKPHMDEFPKDLRRAFDPVARQLRQVKELNDHIQLLVRDSDRTRDAFFLHKVLPELRTCRGTTT